MNTDNPITVVFPTERTSNINRSYERKECISRRQCIAVNASGMPQSVCDVRWYMSRTGDGASPVYCNIYFDTPTVFTSSSGKAGGYGYHKESAAFADACRNAGLQVSCDVSGVGSGAVDSVMEAVAKALGFTHFKVL